MSTELRSVGVTQQLLLFKQIYELKLTILNSLKVKLWPELCLKGADFLSFSGIWLLKKLLSRGTKGKRLDL